MSQTISRAADEQTRNVPESISISHAKEQMSSLVERAAGGETFVITVRGTPRARLVPIGDTRPRREPGQGRGCWKVHDDFDTALPRTLITAFETDRG